MNGTEFARISGNYSTAYIATYEVIEQSVINNLTKFKLRGYFYYGGGTSVGSATGSGFYLDGNYIASGNYRYYPGYTLLGEVEITVGHNNDGSFPGRNVGISASSYHINGYADGNLSAPKINRLATITKANDFNDEQNPYMEFTNPANFKVNLRLEFSGSIISRNGLQTPGGYTFELTDEERKLLRQKCTANTLTVRYVVATLVDGVKESLWSYVDKTMTLINANPEFSNFTFKDVNSVTVALTGNNQNIIKGASNVEVTIPVASKAIAKKETIMNKYRFTCGDKADDQSYSDIADVNLTINGVPNGTFTVYATDKRDNSTPIAKLANQVIDYTPLVKGNIDVYRNNGVSEEVVLQFDGLINEANFGAKSNSIIYAYYQYSVAGSGVWSEPIEITPEVEDGRFSYNAIISGDLENKGFDISNSYEIMVSVFDELSGLQYTDTFGSGIPNLAYHKNGVSVMGKYDVNEGGPFQVQGKNPFRKNLVYAHVNGQILTPVTAWTDAKLNLNIASVIGNKLSWDSANHRIVLEEDANCLKFYTGYNWYNVELAGDRTVRIYKNGESYKGMGYVSHGENYYGQVNSIYVGSGEFKKGDYFEMYINCGRDGTDKSFDVGTFMLIEVIE